MFFWNSLAFSMVQRMLAIWSLVPLPFLKPAWTSGSSWLKYYWILAWRILSITLLACEMSATVQCPIDQGLAWGPGRVKFKHCCQSHCSSFRWRRLKFELEEWQLYLRLYNPLNVGQYRVGCAFQSRAFYSALILNPLPVIIGRGLGRRHYRGCHFDYTIHSFPWLHSLICMITSLMVRT